MTWWEGIAAAIVVFRLIDGMWEESVEEEEIEYTREHFNEKMSTVDRPLLLRLIARQIEEADELSDIDAEAYMAEQFGGIVGYANMPDHALRVVYEDKLGLDQDDVDWQSIVENLEGDLEYLLKDRPSAYSEYAHGSSSDRRFLEEFVILSEHLANESIFFPAEFAQLAVRVREHING